MALQINVAANQAALVNSIQSGVNAYNQRFASQNQINLSINPKSFSQPLGRITGDVKDFEAALAASNARVVAFGASTAVLGATIKSFKELADVTIEVEKTLTDVNRVLGLNTQNLQKFGSDLFDVAKQTATSFQDVSKTALEFSRQGLRVEETLLRTKDAMMLAKLAGMSTSAAVDSLTSTVNGFSKSGVTTTQVLNKLVAVEQNYAVSAGDLAEALARTGQAAQEAGVGLDQLNALVTAAQERTARGGAVIGNALKTIFTRLQRSETLDQLEAYNVAVRDVQGNTLPAVTILQNFAVAYKNLSDAQKANLSEQVAGVYQVNILKAILGDLNNQQSTYSKALRDGANATNEAEIASAKLNLTLSALLSQTATNAQQLANNIGKVTFDPLAKSAANAANSILQSFNQILEGEGLGSDFAIGFLKGVRNLLAGPGAIAAFIVLYKSVERTFSFLTSALPQIAGITTETQNRKNIELAILQILQQEDALGRALLGHTGNQVAQADLLLQHARQQTVEYEKQLLLASELSAMLSPLGVKVGGSRKLQATRAGGYIPPITRMAESLGAKAGGYTPGNIISSPVGGVMNTAESVKYIPGFAQPFINPPANSKAGMIHRSNSIAKAGIDPYLFGGYIPNFAYKQAVMNLESNLSGKAAVFDTKPFPHIRNSGQSSFSSAIADHGGLSNALSDSIRNQKIAGLMFGGFMPNFAANPWTTASKTPTPQPVSAQVNPSAALWTSAAGSVNVAPSSPMGVNQAAQNWMSSSYSAAQALNNFTTTVNNAATSTQNNANVTGQLSTQFRSSMNALMIIGPTIAGFAEQLAFGNKKRAELSQTERAVKSGLSTGITSITTGMGMGAMTGNPYGIAIGAAVGSLIAIRSAINATELSFEDLNEIVQETKNTSQQNISAAERYIKAQENYAELLSQGASQSKLDIASKNIAMSFNEIKDVKLAEELSKTKTGVEGLNSVLNRYQTDKNVLTSALSFATEAKKGKTGSVALSNKALELKGVNLTPEQINQIRGFQLERQSKGYLTRFGLGIAEEFGAKVDYGQITEQNKKQAEILSRDIARKTIGDKGTVEELNAFQESIFDILIGKPEDREKLISELLSMQSGSAKGIESAIEIGRLYKIRNSLELQNVRYLSETTRELKSNDAIRKMQTEFFDFQSEISSSLIDPLDKISEKFNFNSNKLVNESEDSIKKLNADFLDKNLKELLKSTESTDLIKNTIEPIIESIKKGDFLGFKNLIGSAETEMFAAGTGEGNLFDPAILKKLREAYELHEQNLLDEDSILTKNLEALTQSTNIENIKASNLKTLQEITYQEIINNGARERAEIERKSNLSLEMDLLERKMSNEGRYLGLGVSGKAEERNRIRNEMLTKKIVDLETTKSQSAQKDYAEVLNTAKSNLISAASGQTVGSPLYAQYMMQAEAIKPSEIKNADDLRNAIKEISNIRFQDSKQEDQRINTLEKLKSIQKEIETGKTYEFEITKRLNDEELLRAERATSFRYGMAVGFDKLREQADTLGRRLGEEIPTAFTDGMTNALMEVAKGTKTIGDAFKDMAINFGQMIMQEVMRAAIGKALASAFPSLTTVGAGLAGSQKGGLIRAQNGMYISGGRTGDRNLALLEDGEYVLNRNAVRAFGGASALDQFNYRTAPRFGGAFASGGSFLMTPEMAIKNDQLQYTGKTSINSGGLQSINAAEYSAYAYANDEYFIQMRNKAIQNEQQRIQKDFQRRVKNVQLMTSMIGLLGSLSLAKGMNSSKKITTPKPYSNEWFDQNNMLHDQKGGLIGFNSGGFVPYGSRLSDTIPALLTGGEYVMNNSAVRKYGLGTMNAMNYGVAGSTNNSSVSTNNNTNNNNTNISINVDRNNKATYGVNPNSYDKQDIELSKEMARSIHGVVMRTISAEKRYNGELYKNPLRS